MDNTTNHLVGIVPVAKKHSIFNTIWDDGLIRIGKDLNAIQAAVLDCASAGCTSIWINADYEQISLLKREVGSWIQDPVYFWRKHERYPAEHKRYIPIFYSWNHQKDVDRRDSYSWGILNASMVATNIAKNISKKLIPSMFYVAFPFSATSSWQAQKHRKTLIKKRFCFVNDGQSFLDNQMLSFTFTQSDLKEAIKNVKQKGTGFYMPAPEGMEDPNWKTPRPKEERWSARFFELKDVFSFLDVGQYEFAQAKYYYPINSWEEYVTFMKSDIELKAPHKTYFYNREKEVINGYEKTEHKRDYSFTQEDE
tara:strand:- start:19 stop:945 length:927 start_codon:yes stop_codon:yes gene_type:complete